MSKLEWRHYFFLTGVMLFVIAVILMVTAGFWVFVLCGGCALLCLSIAAIMTPDDGIY